MGAPVSDHSPRARRSRTALALVLAAIGVVALCFGTASGVSAVSSLTGSKQLATSDLENAYYRCLDTQTHSLVRPGEPVRYSRQGDVDALLRASGSWLTAARPSDASAPELALVATTDPGACHGSVVELTRRLPGGGTELRVGTGASLPGEGPLPRPDL